MFKTKNYPGKKLNVCNDSTNVRKIIKFRDIYRRMNKPVPDFIKPDFQGALIEEKFLSMVECYKKNSSNLHLKDIITVIELNGTLYIIDGQHRIEMVCRLYLENPAIDDYLIFCYRKVKNMSEARELFEEINKDSHKNKLYIESPQFIKICADELKNQLKSIYGNHFRRRSSKNSRIKSLDDLVRELLEINFISVDDDPTLLYNRLIQYNNKFYKDFNYEFILDKVPNAFYKVEMPAIQDKFIISIKGTNFINYLENEGDIKANHELKKTKSRITRALKLATWNKEFPNKINGYCPIPYCMNVITQNNFHCGHIISEYNGGPTKLMNLRPICAACNLAMGSKNWDEWVDEQKKLYITIPELMSSEEGVSYSSDFELESPKSPKRKHFAREI